MTIIPNITYESVLQPIKNIEERNKAFHKLSDEGKRLEIAWDLLQLVIEKKIGANKLGYWSRNLMHTRYVSMDSEEFQKKLLKLPEECTVCQRGGIMLSTIRLGNNINPYSTNITKGDEDSIDGFNMHDMFIMEREYEYEFFSHPYDKCTEEKIANICCNILVNGNFNTQDKSDYLIIK